ncbi:MAG: phage holin family protein [Solirubrobacterales bacterium]
METITYETRRRPPWFVRVLAAAVLNMLGIWLAGQFDWLSYNDSFWTLLIAAIVLAFVNVFVKPFITILSIPFILVTLGFFLAVVNAFMLWITSVLVPHFDLGSFWNTIGAAIILSIVNLLLGGIMRDFTEKPRRDTYVVE